MVAAGLLTSAGGGQLSHGPSWFQGSSSQGPQASTHCEGHNGFKSKGQAAALALWGPCCLAGGAASWVEPGTHLCGPADAPLNPSLWGLPFFAGFVYPGLPTADQYS